MAPFNQRMVEGKRNSLRPKAKLVIFTKYSYLTLEIALFLQKGDFTESTYRKAVVMEIQTFDE